MDETIGNQQETFGVSEADIGWLAGIIDGEGSIGISMGMLKGGTLNNMSPRIDLGNTDKDLVEKFVRIVKANGGGIYMGIKKESNESQLVCKRRGVGFKPLYIAKAVGFKRTKKILDVVLPHLTGEKQVRAALVLRFIDEGLGKLGVDGKAKYPLYDEEDLTNILAVCNTMRTKCTPLIQGLLRDCTKSPRVRGRKLGIDTVRSHVRA